MDCLAAAHSGYRLLCQAWGDIGSGAVAPLLVLVYGSLRQRSDIDVLLVFEETPFATTRMGRLDVLVISKGQLTELLDLRDPTVTEPILTGILVAGNQELHAQFLARLLEPTVCAPVVCQYLRDHGNECYAAIVEDSLPDVVLTNLAYACSCHEFARWYEVHGIEKTVTASQLAKHVPLLRALLVAKSKAARRKHVDLGYWRDIVFQRMQVA